MPRKKAQPAPEPLHETADPKAEETASGVAVATARAFNPNRVGWGKTAGAIALVAANVAFLLVTDFGLIPADGAAATLLAQVFGGVTFAAIRHLGTRWKTDD